jgi:hypothetical protein
MIVIVMDFESVCDTARAVAAAARGCLRPPHPPPIRDHHRSGQSCRYLLTVARGTVSGVPDSFDENIVDTHDELMSAFDVYITLKNWNTVYTTGGGSGITDTQLVNQGRIDRDLSALMKDYNFLLTNVLCNSFNTTAMTAYQHLTNLDFVRDSTSCQSDFGCIPPADTRLLHL